jgi:hypothetical protein
MCHENDNNHSRKDDAHGTEEPKGWEKTTPDSIRNRCDLQWFSIKFQPFVVELIPSKTPLWDENSNLIPQVKVGKKHFLRLGRGVICASILKIHNS